MEARTGNGWRELYVAALFEPDATLFSRRIADAETALVLRARELFHMPGDHIEEENAMDDAMYALHALRSRLGLGVLAEDSRPRAA